MISVAEDQGSLHAIRLTQTRIVNTSAFQNLDKNLGTCWSTTSSPISSYSDTEYKDPIAKITEDF